jgi:hypothetical protein
MKRDKISEIIEKRTRVAVSGSAFSEAIEHLHELAILCQTVDAVRAIQSARIRVTMPTESNFHPPDRWSADAALRGVAPAIVATIESYVRRIVAELIDSSETFHAGFAAREKDVRIDVRTLLAMRTKDVSVGEIISHDISLSSVSDIAAVFHVLTNLDLWKQFGWLYREDAEETLPPGSAKRDVEMKNQVVGGLQEIFRVRHIVCHESRRSIEVSRADTAEFIQTGFLFLLEFDHIVEGLRVQHAG